MTKAEAKRIAEEDKARQEEQKSLEAETKRNEAEHERASHKARWKEEARRAARKSVTIYEKTSVTDNRQQEKERLVITADKAWDEPDKIAQAIISDLTAERIITGRINLSYSLSSTRLIVNGKVQSDTVHRKFKQKYLNSVQERHPDAHKISIVYNFDISNLIACN